MTRAGFVAGHRQRLAKGHDLRQTIGRQGWRGGGDLDV